MFEMNDLVMSIERDEVWGLVVARSGIPATHYQIDHPDGFYWVPAGELVKVSPLELIGSDSA